MESTAFIIGYAVIIGVSLVAFSLLASGVIWAYIQVMAYAWKNRTYFKFIGYATVCMWYGQRFRDWCDQQKATDKDIRYMLDGQTEEEKAEQERIFRNL